MCDQIHLGDVMRVTSILAAALFVAAPAVAQNSTGPTVYPYAHSHNYCPAGLQPVSIMGTVCCGTPNTKMTYQQATAEPRRARRAERRTFSRDCPIGVKGC